LLQFGQEELGLPVKASNLIPLIKLAPKGLMSSHSPVPPLTAPLPRELTLPEPVQEAV
jgi:hypothetical protein